MPSSRSAGRTSVSTAREISEYLDLQVADLRAVAGRRPGDPEFRRLWAGHEVAVRRADRKTIVHPRVGNIVMECETLATLDQRQEPVVLTPADDEARERLEPLRVLGTEEFPTGSPAR